MSARERNEILRALKNAQPLKLHPRQVLKRAHSADTRLCSSCFASLSEEKQSVRGTFWIYRPLSGLSSLTICAIEQDHEFFEVKCDQP